MLAFSSTVAERVLTTPYGPLVIPAHMAVDAVRLQKELASSSSPDLSSALVDIGRGTVGLHPSRSHTTPVPPTR